MNNFPNQNQIIEAVIKGIIEAKNNFLFWTNNRLSLSYGPNKILTIHVAQEIAKIKNPPEIFIDATTKDILRCSLAKRDQFIEFINQKNLTNGTFDITLDERFEHLNDNDSISKVIISLENGVINSKKEYLNEITRICKIMSTDEKNSSSSLNYGIFAFYSHLSVEARKKLSARIPDLISNFNNIVADYPTLKATFQGGEIHLKDNIEEWAASCYIIEPITK